MAKVVKSWQETPEAGAESRGGAALSYGTVRAGKLKVPGLVFARPFPCAAGTGMETSFKRLEFHRCGLCSCSWMALCSRSCVWDLGAEINNFFLVPTMILIIFSFLSSAPP